MPVHAWRHSSAECLVNGVPHCSGHCPAPVVSTGSLNGCTEPWVQSHPAEGPEHLLRCCSVPWAVAQLRPWHCHALGLGKGFQQCPLLRMPLRLRASSSFPPAPKLIFSCLKPSSINYLFAKLLWSCTVFGVVVVKVNDEPSKKQAGNWRRDTLKVSAVRSSVCSGSDSWDQGWLCWCGDCASTEHGHQYLPALLAAPVQSEGRLISCIFKSRNGFSSRFWLFTALSQQLSVIVL